ncbi:hypothetical protein [Herbiconiux sp. YIM B11900]|uniref:hypothetical protein n=1 Tax=Herbiconiux sp. YIM B11900 TaxID=3404131 RepID=UPI003F8251B7
MAMKSARIPISAALTAAALIGALTAGSVYLAPRASRASTTTTGTADARCALGMTTGDTGTGNPYPELADLDGSDESPFPLGATVVCTTGGAAWTIALGQPILDAGAADGLDVPQETDSGYIVLPVQAGYVGTDTSIVTDDLTFSYVDAEGEQHDAVADPARTDSLYDFPRVFPNGIASGSVVIPVPQGDAGHGRFVVRVEATGQTVNFTL